ncbi:unnamed protein product [Brugia timori]|uniref:Transmembrane protein n=1 Tax=Brugia timori TaxID=42155 RepID=A0A0R3QQF2_9BILA|nr:unnamed protein product [Brugia timori]
MRAVNQENSINMLMKWRRFDITAFMSAFLFGKIKLNYRRQPSVLGIVVISGLNFLKFWDANGTFKFLHGWFC